MNESRSVDGYKILLRFKIIEELTVNSNYLPRTDFNFATKWVVVLLIMCMLVVQQWRKYLDSDRPGFWGEMKLIQEGLGKIFTKAGVKLLVIWAWTGMETVNTLWVGSQSILCGKKSLARPFELEFAINCATEVVSIIVKIFSLGSLASSPNTATYIEFRASSEHWTSYCLQRAFVSWNYLTSFI